MTDPSVQLCIGWYARGITKSEIARRLNRNMQTIMRWIKAHPEEIASEVLALKNGLAEVLAPHVPEAVETTVAIMRQAQRNDATRLMAATQVLDEVFGKPVVRTEQKMAAVVTVIFEDSDPGPQVIEGVSREVGYE